MAPSDRLQCPDCFSSPQRSLLSVSSERSRGPRSAGIRGCRPPQAKDRQTIDRRAGGTVSESRENLPDAYQAQRSNTGMTKLTRDRRKLLTIGSLSYNRPNCTCDSAPLFSSGEKILN